MNRFSWLYLIGVVVTFLLCGIYLNKAHGEETASAGSEKRIDPKSYIWPRESRMEAPMKVKDAKSCREYLTICERSCKERGSMFNFSCIGQEFQPFEEHSRCLCADDLYALRQTSKKDQVQITREQEQ